MRFTVVGWIIMLGLLYLMSKSKLGYHIIYYSLVLILILLLVGQNKAITSIMLKQKTN
jgi:hypothetical protein